MLLTRERAGYSSNYRQLELARGKKVLAKEDVEETRSSRLTWYRQGGRYRMAGRYKNGGKYRNENRNRNGGRYNNGGKKGMLAGTMTAAETGMAAGTRTVAETGLAAGTETTACTKWRQVLDQQVE